MIWVLIGLAIVGWLLGLLLQVGPVVHLLLVVAAVLLVVEVRRDRT
ncbi:MAG TPA: lmo0937 family membrane protein [Candidatus Limnocylindria bacterium]